MLVVMSLLLGLVAILNSKGNTMYTYYNARKELSSMFWQGAIDGLDYTIMESLLALLSVSGEGE